MSSTVKELIEDLEVTLKDNADAALYRIGFKKSVSDTSVVFISAFHWDEEEFFLVSEGDEVIYDLDPISLSPQVLLDKLKQISDKHVTNFSVFARVGVTKTPDGDRISMNLPINGTVISDKMKLVYFFNETEEDAAIPKQVFMLRLEATATIKSEKVLPGNRYAVLSFVHENKMNKAEMLSHYDLFKDGWKDIVTEEKGVFDEKSLNEKTNTDVQKAYKTSKECGVSHLIYAGG